MSKKKFFKCCIKKWAGPSIILIGIGMLIAIIVPFWIWVIAAGICLICCGIKHYFC